MRRAQGTPLYTLGCPRPEGVRGSNPRVGSSQTLRFAAFFGMVTFNNRSPHIVGAARADRSAACAGSLSPVPGVDLAG
jgi:hypothetical protein